MIYSCLSGTEQRWGVSFLVHAYTNVQYEKKRTGNVGDKKEKYPMIYIGTIIQILTEEKEISLSSQITYK